MNALTRNGLFSLATRRVVLGVSIYMPVDRTGGALVNNQRLRLLLHKAEKFLIERGLRPADASQQLEGVRNELSDPAFWASLSEGVALFIEQAGHLAYHFPVAFPEMVIVGSRFQATPLLPLIANTGEFYLLALSQNQVRLMEGNRWQIRELDLHRLPTNLQAALQYDDPEEVRQFHSARPGTHTSRDATFHGQGGSPDQKKPELQAFFRVLDRELKSVLTDTSHPLLIACVDYLFPVYKEVNSYPNLAHDHLSGNPDRLSAAELRALAWPIVAEHFAKEMRQAVSSILPQAKAGKGLYSLAEVLAAAAEGAVDTLLLDPQRQQWGTYDAARNILHLDDCQTYANEDLLNLAMVMTVENRGKVFSVSADGLPDQSPIAALLRYSAQTLRPATVSEGTAQTQLLPSQS